MGLISWIIFGGLIGWLSSKIAGTDQQQGWILNILLGIVGAFVGGAVYSWLFDDGFSIEWSIGSFIVALLGGIAVTVAFSALTRKA